MTLHITPEFERFVLERVSPGAYEDTDAVLEACIEALELIEADIAAEDVEWLEREIQLGIESAETEPLIPGDEVVELLREEVRRRTRDRDRGKPAGG